MTLTTDKKMFLLMEKNEERINAKVSKRMKELILTCADKLNINESQYVKLAIAERLEKDLMINYENRIQW